MMNKAVFLDRLDRFNVPASVVKKYSMIYEQGARAEELSPEEIKNRLSQIAFAGYIYRGNRLLASNSEIENSYRRGDYNLCTIPYSHDADLLGLHTVRNFHPAPDLEQIGIVSVYTFADFPFLSLRDVVAQLSEKDAERAKAIALRLKDDFVETGYLNLAQAYEYQIELLA